MSAYGGGVDAARQAAVAGGNLSSAPRRRRRAAICYPCGVKRRGRILAVKWGLNPNSSSLGVDVTFLLFGAALVSLLTPVVGALVRLRRARAKRA